MKTTTLVSHAVLALSAPLAIALPAFALVGCDGAAGDGLDDSTVNGEVSSEAAPPASHAAEPWLERHEWRRQMSKTPTPKAGCFRAVHPSTEWVEVPCETPPAIPFRPASSGGRPAGQAETVGNGADYSSVVSGPIAWAEGSFPVVSGVTSVASNGVANAFSLQVNSNFFSGSSMCSGAANPSSCLAWQQFVYSYGYGGVFMQYWLLNYYNTCPSGWWSYGAHCYRNSTGLTPVPAITAADLGSTVLTGTAASFDVAMVATGDTLYMVSESSIVGLSASWSAAEFNIFGDGGASSAVFNSGSTVVVQTLTDSASQSTSAPACDWEGFTGETNSLTIVPTTCAFGGTPGIQFTQSNVANATAYPCPSAPSVAGAYRPLYAKSNGLCMGVKSASKASGASIVQQGCLPGKGYQHFYFLPVPGMSGLYNIVPALNSSLCLQRNGVGSAVTQVTCDSTNANQRFQMVSAGSGYYNVTGAGGSNCVTVPADSNQGENITMQICSAGSTAQMWQQ